MDVSTNNLFNENDPFNAVYTAQSVSYDSLIELMQTQHEDMMNIHIVGLCVLGLILGVVLMRSFWEYLKP